MSTPTILCRLDDISDGGAKRVVFDGQSFAVFRHGEEVYAISDRCSHQGGSLSNGFLDGNVVECPARAMFDIRTEKHYRCRRCVAFRLFRSRCRWKYC